MTTTREAVQELASLLERDRQGYVNPFDVAAHLRRILEETEPDPTTVKNVFVGGPDPDAQLRLSALSEAVTASSAHMSTEEPDETVRRARAFYAFLAAAEQPTTTDEATR